jgi:ATP-dependent Clp protease ATP-binding subunit ClpC
MVRHADSLILVWKLAELEARYLRNREIDPAHFFLGLLKIVDIDVVRLAENWQPEGRDSVEQLSADVELLRSIFTESLIETTPLRRRLRSRLSKGAAEEREVLRRSGSARALFAKAETMNSEIVRPDHLLAAILDTNISEVSRVLADSGIDREKLTRDVKAVLVAAPPREKSNSSPRVKRRKTILDYFGRDLTDLAKAGKLGPIIGRKDEIRALAQMLLQSRKNNIILTGEAGVGKTGVVEGLAQRFASGEVPEEFQSIRIVEISMASLVAGTTFRGDFEARFEATIKEAAANPNLVLFIDEIHLLMGAGQSAGSGMDAANILKPALSRGEIRVIGATTTSEYRRFIEKDPALVRRFQTLEISEPNRSETLKILEGLKSRLEGHHNVSIAPDALSAAVDLSVRYVPDRRLPDKAVDLIDQACAQARLQSLTSIRNPTHARIDASNIASVVSRMCGVPLLKITTTEKDQLLKMEEHLRKRVKGQDQALIAVSDAIRVAKSGLRNPSKPMAVFLLAGPSGSGKTELAKTVAEFLFGSEGQMVRLDMSEFMEEHSVSKLIGSPPGYRDHQEGGQLTEKIRTNPYTVLLLDEVEKAHPKIFDIFLQVFDEGVLTDSQGRQCNFRETIIFLTSNVGAADAPARQIGFYEGHDATNGLGAAAVLDAVKKSFRPEFINRLSQIIVFQPLDKATLRQIVDKFTDRLKSRLTVQGVNITLEDSAYEILMNRGFSQNYGAREMERTIDTLLSKPLAKALLEEKIGPGTTLRVSGTAGQISFFPVGRKI